MSTLSVKPYHCNTETTAQSNPSTPAARRTKPTRRSAYILPPSVVVVLDRIKLAMRQAGGAA